MRIRVTLVGLAMVVSLTACTGAPRPVAPSTRSAAPGALVSIGISEPQHLIPQNTTEANGGQVLRALFTPLVTFVLDHGVKNSIEMTRLINEALGKPPAGAAGAPDDSPQQVGSADGTAEEDAAES